jgi:DNA repair exonuclease SbcCD ATPase subunit
VVVRTSLEDSTGGGLVDIVCIALRWAITELYNDPVMNGPLQLDEPGKHVSENYAIKLAQFLKECGKTFDRQIIMVTHQPYLSAIADRNHDVVLRGGKSVVTTS